MCLAGWSFGISNTRGKFCLVGCPGAIWLKKNRSPKFLQTPQCHNFNGHKDLDSFCHPKLVAKQDLQTAVVMNQEELKTNQYFPSFLLFSHINDN